MDTVLYFEGQPQDNYKLLRAVKNRFGSAQEVGVFEMREDGVRGGKDDYEHRNGRNGYSRGNRFGDIYDYNFNAKNKGSERADRKSNILTPQALLATNTPLLSMIFGKDGFIRTCPTANSRDIYRID